MAYKLNFIHIKMEIQYKLKICIDQILYNT